MTAADALQRLGEWPRMTLANLPTPVRAMRRLAAELGGPPLDLVVKMDAETGFALGGNKVRKLEFELEASRLEGVTHLLTAGGPQSNHCRVTAAAAARLGLSCTLVLNGPEPDPPTGNAQLHRLFGAHVVTVNDRAARTDRMNEVADELTQQGQHPHVVPIGASTGLGCLGYARAAQELFTQLSEFDPKHRTVVFVPSSSCGTLAGLLLGATLLGREDVVLVGVSADASSEVLTEKTLAIAKEGARLLAWDGEIDAADMVVIDDQVGAGYGARTPAATEAIELFARTEGLVLDPTYTAKGAAALLDWVRSGRTRDNDRVVFLHTGGHPGLLA